MFGAGTQFFFADGESDERSFKGTWGGVQSTPFSWLQWDERTGVRQLRAIAEQPVRGLAGVGRDNGLTNPGKTFFHIEGSVE